MNDPRGSLWRKWDLHVHTPASIVQHYGGNTEDAWEKFITDLEALPPEFSVIGINDYLFLDGYRRVLEERRKGRLTASPSSAALPAPGCSNTILPETAPSSSAVKAKYSSPTIPRFPRATLNWKSRARPACFRIWGRSPGPLWETTGSRGKK